MTGWAASLSDFAASVVRRKPAAPNFLYGYEGITFFSAGFAGAMIILARVWILVATSEQGMAGLKLEPPGSRRLLLLVGGVIKCGAWLVLAARRKAQPFAHPRSRWQTRPHRCLTSFAVAAGLGLVMLARWKPFDPLIAIAVAGTLFGQEMFGTALSRWPARLLWPGNGKAHPRKPRGDLRLSAMFTTTTACASAPPDAADQRSSIIEVHRLLPHAT